MFVATVIVSVLTALMLSASGALKLKRHPKIIEAVHETVKVPLEYLPVLAGLEFAAAAGILLGLAVAPLGIAAATGAVLYMLGAIVAHVRVKDMKGIASPVLPLAMAAATLALRIATA